MDLEELFQTGIKQMYYTEHRLHEALEELESQSMRDELASEFAEHRKETEGHIERLEEVFDRLDMEAQEETDPVVEALIEAHEEVVNNDPDEDTMDRHNIAAGQKSEHYEIAVYGNLTPIAAHLGYDDIADVLEENMREEQDALETLSEIGQAFDQEQPAV